MYLVMHIVQAYVLHAASDTHHLFSSPAFHILKDTTIQFTLEKVPIDEDTQFIFLTTEEPCKSTGLLRIEGKFVNPVKVYTISVL